MADNDRSGTIDVVEFGDVLDAAYTKLSKEELDNIFRLVDRNNRGRLTEQDLRTAFADKERSLLD